MPFSPHSFSVNLLPTTPRKLHWPLVVHGEVIPTSERDFSSDFLILECSPARLLHDLLFTSFISLPKRYLFGESSFIVQSKSPSSNPLTLLRPLTLLYLPRSAYHNLAPYAFPRLYVLFLFRYFLSPSRVKTSCYYIRNLLAF